MDPLTQAALGAVVGQACAGKQLGARRAAAWGAVAGAFPDVDSLIAGVLTNDPLIRLQLHRGITHSLFFAPVLGPIWGWFLWKWKRRGEPTAGAEERYWPWLVLITCALLSHPLLDFCTHYGTQLLSPFTDRRFALPAISIIDPRYTLTLVFGLLVACVLRDRYVQAVSALTLILSSAYILLGLKINSDAEAWAREDLESKGMAASEIHAFPTLFQLPHRRLIARATDADYVGFVSMAEPCNIDWQPQARYDAPEVRALRDSPEGQIFEWFADGLTSAYRQGNRVILGDLRYGFTTDARQGNWILESEVTLGGNLARPVYRRNARPRASAENIAALWQEAYPTSCSAFSGTLLLDP